MSSPTARTLKMLRDAGYTAQVVEKRLPHTFITQDLFGCIDLVAIKSGERGVIGVQATSGSNHNARVLKSRVEPRLRIWLEAGNRFRVVSWKKKGARGKRKLWEARVQELNVEDLTVEGVK